MTVAYFETSALLKRVFEDEASALELMDFLEGSDLSEKWVCSDLARIECERAMRRRLPAEDVERALGLATSDLTLVSLSPRVVSLAGSIGDPLLRSLDAIHLATAQLVEADVMVTYDHRLADAAQQLGMHVEMPGVA